MRRRVASVALAGFLGMAQSGCLSLGSQIGFWTGGVDDFPECVMVYLGTRMNVESLKELPSRPWGGRCSWPPVFALIDLLPSLCVDTALLPLSLAETAYMAVSYWTSPERCSSEDAWPP
jgi:uncharacterized protein YceK